MQADSYQKVMDELLRYATIIGGLVSMIGIPMLAWHGRKLFAERGEAVSPLQMKEYVDNSLITTRHAIVNEINTIVGNSGTQQMLKMDEISRNLTEARSDIKEVRLKAEAAKDAAKDAGHEVKLLETDVDGYKALVDSRLRSCEDKLDERRARRETGNSER